MPRRWEGLQSSPSFRKNGVSGSGTDSRYLSHPLDKFIVWLQQIPQARFYPCKIRFLLVDALEHFPATSIDDGPQRTLAQLETAQ